MNINTILIILASICWFLSAISFPKTSPVSLGWLGMFFFGLSLLIH